MTDRRPRRRGSVAVASRVAIGGLSLSVMLGMVTALSLSEPPEEAAETEPLVVAGPATTEGAPVVPATPGTTIVVRRIHVVAGPSATGATGEATTRSTPPGTSAAVSSPPPVAAATPAPAAATAPSRPAPAPVARSRAS